MPSLRVCAFPGNRQIRMYHCALQAQPASPSRVISWTARGTELQILASFKSTSSLAASSRCPVRQAQARDAGCSHSRWDPNQQLPPEMATPYLLPSPPPLVEASNRKSLNTAGTGPSNGTRSNWVTDAADCEDAKKAAIPRRNLLASAAAAAMAAAPLVATIGGSLAGTATMPPVAKALQVRHHPFPFPPQAKLKPVYSRTTIFVTVDVLGSTAGAGQTGTTKMAPSNLKQTNLGFYPAPHPLGSF